MNNKPVLVASGLTKTFRDAGNPVSVLKDLNLTVMPGTTIAVTGSSGSGKSTLLHLLGGLDAPDAGRVEIAGVDIATASEGVRSETRNRRLGFVYQFHHLLAELTALENVAMPLLIRREDPDTAYQKAKAILEAVGLADRLGHFPSQLSGGQRQRCAIARALVTVPDVVLADEPTGNLDTASAKTIFELFCHLASEKSISVVVVTHDEKLSALCDEVYLLENGQLVPKSRA